MAPSETPEFKRAQELSRMYCAACHVYPEPNLHDVHTWRTQVLQLMCKNAGFEPKPNTAEKLAAAEWWSIWEDFYFQAAPKEAIPQAPRSPIRSDLRLFTVEDPHYRQGLSYATMVQIDSETRQIYVGNALTRSLDVLDQRGRGLASLKVNSTLVQLLRQPDGWLATQIGMVVPDDRPLGRLTRLSRTALPFVFERDILTNLVRPIECAVGDLNGDGRSDLVVCSYGNRTGVSGQLAWYKNRGGTNYTEHVLVERPGATRCLLLDYNKDGRLDIVALMAQAKEGVFLFRNDGDDQFTEIPLVTQSPAWGYVSLQLADFNGDGHPDLLTANGDMGDFECPPKRYHGVRIHLNDGQFNFRDEFFYPLNGAYKALAADFDQDGDLDIAAISFFPDYEHSPEESFVFLENRGKLRFEARTFPDCERGRWLTMDAGDLDGDGDIDVVLGAAFKTPFRVPENLKARWEKEGPSLLILRNNLKSP
ncbi:MAG: VCBS repeat-containing protein [Verrucomicrobia bacterium]|nr:VCBS repeat-containing protein [Verrucomicrobiota bacterium]